MLELTFLVGENRTRNTKRRLTNPSVFNDLLKDVKFFREFSRRVRELDLSVMKAQEMRNLAIFLFPLIIQCIETEAKERRLWFLLAFMLRSCVVPNMEYENINESEIRNASKQFYSLYQQLFSVKNCTYSIHTLVSHLLQIRSQGPFTETSAFVFENFYGEMRRSFMPGTQSTLKQIFIKTYLKRTQSYHCCEKTIYYSEKDTALERNSLIYIYSDGNYNMYRIHKTDENDSNLFHCNVQGKIDIEFDDARDFVWSKVGVFKEGATGGEDIVIQRNSINGKVIKVSSLLITCPNNVLREQ